MLELHECYLLGLKEYILFFLFLPLKYPCWEGVWHWASPLSLNRHNIYYPVWVTTLKSVVPEHTCLILFTNEDFHVFNEFLCSEYLYLLNIISWFGCFFSRLVLETLDFNLLNKTKQSHWLCSQRVWEKQQIPADLVLLYWHLMPINVGRWQIQGDGAKWTSVLDQIWVLLEAQKQRIPQTNQFLSPFLYSNLSLLKSTHIRANHLCYTDVDCQNHSDFKSNHACKTRILTWTNHPEYVVTYCLIQDFL